jgi:hypothetical protein
VAMGRRPITSDLNWASPLARSLVAWYPISRSSSVHVVVDSARNQRGLRAASAPPGAVISAGPFGPMLVTQTAEIYTDSAVGGFSASNATIAQWVYIPDTSRRGVFLKIGGGTSGFALGVGNTQTDNSGNNLIALYEFVRYVNSGVAIGTGFHHIAMTINGSGHPRLFIDGRAVYSDTTGAPSSPSAGINLFYSGSSNGPPPDGCGFIDGGLSLYDPRTRWCLYRSNARRSYLEVAGSVGNRRRRFFLAS